MELVIVVVVCNSIVGASLAAAVAPEMAPLGLDGLVMLKKGTSA